MTGMMHSAGARDSTMQPDFHDFDPTAPEPSLREEPKSKPESGAWREEVSTRLARYRTRRKPRAPRYPSLLLPFDSAGTWSQSSVREPEASVSESLRDSFLERDSACDPARKTDVDGEPETAPASRTSIRVALRPKQVEEPPDSFTNIIEFPRSAAIPVFQASTLADPIVDRPRILEAPEIVPPPPALGGILIEPAQSEIPDRAPSAESYTTPASISRRFLAAGLDMLILIVALSASGALFLRLNPIRAPLASVAAILITLLATLWMAYQFMFIVFTGSTPGLRATRLRIAKFDGSAVPRRTRRWRVLASFLSAFAAGLGYLWCFLDQDALCWHDRITRTQIQSSEVARTH
jgi:uncharacterized RDD family membrane protein YckC